MPNHKRALGSPQFELALPTLKSHQHVSELVPCEPVAVYDDARHTRLDNAILFDSAANSAVDDLIPEFAIAYVGDRERTTHFFNQLS